MDYRVGRERERARERVSERERKRVRETENNSVFTIWLACGAGEVVQGDVSVVDFRHFNFNVNLEQINIY